MAFEVICIDWCEGEHVTNSVVELLGVEERNSLGESKSKKLGDIFSKV